MPLKKKQINPFKKNTRTYNQAGEGIEQNSSGPKNGNRDSKENTKGGYPGDGKPRRPGTTDANITNRIQEIEERISGVKDTIENIDTSVKENTKCKNLLTQNI
jgi:hypothetical protein